jgi:hypothetical protein
MGSVADQKQDKGEGGIGDDFQVSVWSGYVAAGTQPHQQAM